MRAVFISYRRDDTAGEARALYQDLVAVLGQDAVFMDVDSIALGRDFREALHERLESCDVMLALIGSEWLDSRGEPGKRRLDEPGDFVRQEIAAALKRNIPVTPVLLQGARMPTTGELPEDLESLAYRNGFELRHGRWESDVKEMMSRLGLAAGQGPAAQPAAQDPPAPNKRSWLAMGGVLAVVLAAVFGGLQVYQSGPQAPRVPVEEPVTRPPAPPPAESGSRKERVEAAARRGFEALLERNAALALAAFEQAYEIWDVYQSVDEIRRLLRSRQSELANPFGDAWPQFYKEMIDRNFQLPSDLREAFKAAAK